MIDVERKYNDAVQLMKRHEYARAYDLLSEYIPDDYKISKARETYCLWKLSPDGIPEDKDVMAILEMNNLNAIMFIANIMYYEKRYQLSFRLYEMCIEWGYWSAAYYLADMVKSTEEKKLNIDVGEYKSDVLYEELASRGHIFSLHYLASRNHKSGEIGGLRLLFIKFLLSIRYIYLLAVSGSTDQRLIM